MNSLRATDHPGRYRSACPPRALLLVGLLAPTLVAATVSAAGQEKAFRYRVPDEPALVGRHSLLHAAFDDDRRPRDASYSVGDSVAGGDGFEFLREGRFGSAIRSAAGNAILHYHAAHNLNAPCGTISMWVATGDGAALGDGIDHWLFGWRGQRIAGVFLRGSDGALVFGVGRRAIAPETSYALPLEPLGRGWHHVTVSWDSLRRLVWLGCDGRGISLALDPTNLRQPDVLFLGSSPNGLGAATPVNIAIDDFAIYDLPLDKLAEPAWPANVDRALVWQAEVAARRFLHAIERHQLGGGWPLMYAWPTMIACGSQGRDAILGTDVISNDKRWATAATATQFLYAWELFGDPNYLRVARATGDLFVSAWERNGAWAHTYETTPDGPKALGGSVVKLQDSNQSHPVYFLAYLHRLTGDDRYLATAKAGGEFVLAAQNPNGSWSYGFDLDRKVGVTALGVPHGGEINDRCMNDAMDLMLLMYHLTQDDRYLAALSRAGEWLLRSQSTGVTAGWAEQYDAEDRPAWARDFEPPAIAPGRSVDAAEALRLMWRLTGDQRYRDAILRFAAWLERNAEPTGWWEYYDPETGRPLLASGRKMYFMDDPRQLAEYQRRMPAGEGTPRPEKRANPVRLRAWAEERVAGGAFAGRQPSSVTESAAACAATATAVTKAITEQDATGFWIHPPFPAGGYGPAVHAREQNTVELLRYAEKARIAIGELPPAFRGDCDLLQSAYPSDRWLDTPLRKRPALRP